MTAAFVHGDEYERLWERLVSANPAYATYRTRTKRRLPIVRFTPISPA